MIKSRPCKICQSVYHTAMFHKPRKPIKKKGKRTLEYEEWRDNIAKPYLDKKYGHICSKGLCNITTGLDVDHIIKRGSHPELKMSLSNVRYLCRPHHQEIT